MNKIGYKLAAMTTFLGADPLMMTSSNKGGDHSEDNQAINNQDLGNLVKGLNSNKSPQYIQDFKGAQRAIMNHYGVKSMKIDFSKGYDRVIQSKTDVEMAVNEMKEDVDRLSNNGVFVSRGDREEHDKTLSRLCAYKNALLKYRD